MKVIHLVSGLRGGGAEQMIFEFCRQAGQDTSMQMSVVVMGGDDQLAGKFSREGIRVFQPALQVGKSPKNSVATAVSVLKSIRYCVSAEVDIIHAHMFHAAIAAVFVKLVSPRKKIVFSLHNTRQRGLLRRLLLWSLRVFRKLDLIFPGQQKLWFLKERTFVVRNGIPAEKFNIGHPRDPIFTFLYVGRFEKQKRPHLVLELANQLRGAANFRVLLYGDGSERERLQKQLGQLDLGHICELKHFTENITEVMSSCHCLVLPSLYEGLPLVVLEAAAADLPVLATRGANSCGVLDHTNSFVVDVQQFTVAAVEILKNYDEALRRSHRLRALVDEAFRIEKAYEELIAAYRSII